MYDLYIFRQILYLMVMQVAQAGGYAVQDGGEVVQVTVPIGTLRKQTVTVDLSGKDKEGHGIISYSSTCGPANPEHLGKLLKYNTQMVHGAFAIKDTPAGEMVCVQANQLAETADPLEISRLLTAIAWQADKVEEKLLGGDNH